MTQTRPNLLFITTDQQRFDTIAALGAKHMLTPHLDWLVNTGVTFTKAYADAPICVPARSTMITGQHYINMPDGFGNFGQPTTAQPDQTLPAILTRHGYQTKSVGKLHYHPVRTNYGWEHTEVLADYYWEMEKHPEYGVPMDHGLAQNEMQPAISTVHESHSLTRWTVERAARFLDTRDETRPFCLHMGFSNPHPPFDPCRNYWDLYADIPQPDPIYGDWSKEVEDIDPALMQPTWTLNGIDSFSPEVLRAAKRAYAALITQIDYSLGILFARLREKDLLENTLIVFCSDHGEMLGDHHMGSKTLYLEGSAHVPMIMRGPESMPAYDELRGIRNDSLVCHADIFSTFLNAADVPAEAQPANDGFDLFAVAKGASTREHLIAGYRDWYAVIEPRFKYMTSTMGGELFFDLKADPMEQHECIRADEHTEDCQRMSKLLVEKLKERNWALPDTKTALTRKQAVTKPWPGFHHRSFAGDDVLH